GALLGACGRAQPRVLVSEKPVQGTIEPGRVPATMVPTPRPIDLVDDKALQRELDSFLKEQQGAYGVAIQDLRGPVAAGFDAADRFQLGSLYKLVLMAEVMRQLRDGRLSLAGSTITTLPDYSFIEPEGR